jgi:hypothetical protein
VWPRFVVTENQYIVQPATQNPNFGSEFAIENMEFRIA